MKKNKKVHEKHVLLWNIHYFVVFKKKRILHYNRAIIAVNYIKNQEKTRKIRFTTRNP